VKPGYYCKVTCGLLQSDRGLQVDRGLQKSDHRGLQGDHRGLQADHRGLQGDCGLQSDRGLLQSDHRGLQSDRGLLKSDRGLQSCESLRWLAWPGLAASIKKNALRSHILLLRCLLFFF
jgi:hypothetical protein